jgi:uncharacterized protein YndB with AHSA1/START domain
MSAHRAAVEIHAAPETVFAAMTDPDIVVKWVGGLVASEPPGSWLARGPGR